jgi:hypothetical protein
MKFCRDCKHLWGGDMCSCPALGQNPVTGATKKLTAEGVRAMQSRCGSDARWFEPRPKSALSRALTWLRQL